MSMFAMASGQLVADPVRRTSEKGTPFTTATLRASTGEGEAALVSTIAFGAEAERLLQLHKGDAVSVSGRAKLTRWEGRDGETRHGINIVANEVAAARPRPRPQSESSAGGRSTSPRAYPHQRSTVHPGGGDGRPFDDAIPF